MRYQVLESLCEKHIYDLQVLYKKVMNRTRSITDLSIMLENCLFFALCDIDSDNLIGFARILSDQVYRAVIYDVMVETNYQGMGIGRLLMDTVLNHPKMKCIERIELYTIDKASFYEKWGFVSLNDRMTLMRKTTR